jgi:hypothetical protein
MVVKVSFPHSSKILQTEAAVYEHLDKFNISSIPKFYGLFKWAGGLAIVISDEGESVSAFDTLNYLTR